MSDKDMKIEQRLQNMKNIYLKIDDLIDKLPEEIPEKIRVDLKNAILGDQALKELMRGLDSHRPPRIFLIGHTGVGKSSLINALCGCHIAKVSDTRSCTENTRFYKAMDGNRVLMEICDTRGIAESESVDKNVSAEQLLIDQVQKFSPDVAILMLDCTIRDNSVDSDIQFMKMLTDSYLKTNSQPLPVVVVINKCDGMPPKTKIVPSEYPQSKIRKIEEVTQRFVGTISKNGLQIVDIIAVSSLIEWQLEDGSYVDEETIDSLPPSVIETLRIGFDGRYHIEELFDLLLVAIQDYEAQMGLRMAGRLSEVVHRLAKHLNGIFCAISATVAATPIPVSDIKILLLLQATLVCLIASLSGRDITIETAVEFILSLGGVTGVGFALRTIAQQASKFVNRIWAGAGSAISSGIAALGTGAIGKAAIAYYIDGTTVEIASEKLDAIKKKEK